METERKPGPHIVDGKLFFKLLDGSTISCNCIGEPFAWQIVDLWQPRSTTHDWDVMTFRPGDRAPGGSDW